jgi:hypothetical protein
MHIMEKDLIDRFVRFMATWQVTPLTGNILFYKYLQGSGVGYLCKTNPTDPIGKMWI